MNDNLDTVNIPIEVYIFDNIDNVLEKIIYDYNYYNHDGWHYTLINDSWHIKEIKKNINNQINLQNLNFDKTEIKFIKELI